MRRFRFSWSRLSWSLHPPSGRAQWRRESSHLWALLCVLPMLAMGTLSNVPHEHELREFAQAIQAEHPERAELSGGLSRSFNASSGFYALAGVKAPTAARLASLRLKGAHEADCLLCQWASVAGAWLVVALSLSWPLARVVSRIFTSAFCGFAVPLSLRSRAPPAVYAR